jgi:hypothetical protein
MWANCGPIILRDQAENGIWLDAQEARIAASTLMTAIEATRAIRDAGSSDKRLQRPGTSVILIDVASED